MKFFALKPARSFYFLFHCYALGEVAGLIHIQTADGGNVISQQLQWEYGDDGGEHPWRFGDPQNVVSHAWDELIAFSSHCNDHAATGLGLLDL